MKVKIKMNLKKFIRPDLSDLRPYQVKDVPHRIKMDANENPFDLPKDIKELLASELLKHPFNRYPDPTAKELRVKLSEQLRVNIEQIVMGNGSDELINYLITAFGRDDARVVFPIPTFSMYEILAKVAGVEVCSASLTEDFDISVDKLIAQLKPGGTNLVFFSYPNNPTGNCFDRQGIIDILERDDTIVIVDEAYYEFSGKTFIPILNQHPNLVILRTFSKAYGLAGLRIGYMIAHPDIASEVHKVRLPYNLNSFSQKVALKLLEHNRQVTAQISVILKEREKIFQRLAQLDYIQPFPTDANFVLFRTEADAERLFKRLLTEGILIRNLNCPGLLRNCLRVTVGTSEENDAFLNGLL
ncbi:TPA: histidinol-phosphate transaminase [Candidatus Poribacteria bacterium]|nr:histidinol-phosphate transaminase [Candidatus Poribacteria bacterium]